MSLEIMDSNHNLNHGGGNQDPSPFSAGGGDQMMLDDMNTGDSFPSSSLNGMNKDVSNSMGGMGMTPMSRNSLEQLRLNLLQQQQMIQNLNQQQQQQQMMNWGYPSHQAPQGQAPLQHHMGLSQNSQLQMNQMFNMDSYSLGQNNVNTCLNNHTKNMILSTLLGHQQSSDSLPSILSNASFGNGISMDALDSLASLKLGSLTNFSFTSSASQNAAVPPSAFQNQAWPNPAPSSQPSSTLPSAVAASTAPSTDNSLLSAWSERSAALLGDLAVAPNEVTKKTNKKKQQNKDKPRRALSAYNIFFKEERNRILADIPDSEAKVRVGGRKRKKTPHGKIGFEKLAQLIGQRWRELSDAESAIYREKAAADAIRYKEEMKAYLENQRIANLSAVGSMEPVPVKQPSDNVFMGMFQTDDQKRQRV